MKVKNVFVCQECGYESGKWLGKCPDCGNWNSFVEESIREDKKKSTFKSQAALPVHIDSITAKDEERIKTGISELDTVLGGGVVPGSMVLVAGEPGIGKSTLLLQICDSLSTEKKVMYVSGEESEKQIKLRADRLGVSGKELYILGETNIDNAIDVILKEGCSTVIVDSVQTMYTEDVQSAAGSVSQVRDVTMRLMRVAKENSIAVFIVGHVTKEGSIAGPRVLEHMVDTVLSFEGERQQLYRILRAVKNRFGSTNEIAVFEMNDKGLCEVLNPSMMLIAERSENTSGSSVSCLMEGTRPIMAEVQALVSTTTFGIPRRMASGFDIGRMNLLIAVLEKRAGLNLQNQDIYINVVGGIRIDETAADLSVAMAIVSSFKNLPISLDTAFLGEIGLTGELRSIQNAEKRVSECAKMGFKTLVLPYENAKNLDNNYGVKIIAAKNIAEAMKYLK